MAEQIHQWTERWLKFPLFFPHIFVWGSCFWFCIPPPPPPPSARRLPQPTNTTCSHTTCPHTTCHHTTCPHTTCPHTTSPHTTCPHTTCPHTTCPHTTCHHTTCPHTQLVPSLCVAGVAWHLAISILTLRGRRGRFGVAGVALGDIHLHFTWQAWHVVTSAITLRGRRGTDATGLALVARPVLN